MRKDRTRPIECHLRNFGFFQTTWTDFESRARHYKRSSSFRPKAESQPNDFQRRLADGEEVDLLDWFEKTLVRGLRQGMVHWLILTGGSSSWPFVRDIVDRVFQLKPERVLESSDPRGTIAAGLALKPAVQEKLKEAQEALRRERHDKVAEILSATDRLLADQRQRLAQELSAQFTEKRLRALLQEDQLRPLDQLQERISRSSSCLFPGFRRNCIAAVQGVDGRTTRAYPSSRSSMVSGEGSSRPGKSERSSRGSRSFLVTAGHHWLPRSCARVAGKPPLRVGEKAVGAGSPATGSSEVVGGPGHSVGEGLANATNTVGGAARHAHRLSDC